MELGDIIFIIIFTFLGYGLGRARNRQQIKKMQAEIQDAIERYERIRGELNRLRQDYLDMMDEG